MATSLDRPAPSTAAIAIATAIVAGIGGYFVGQASSLGLFGSGGKTRSTASPKDDDDADSDSGEEEKVALGDLRDRDFGNSGEECKLVLVVRTDLGMTKGKIGAQCGHATLACYKTLHKTDAGRRLLRRWERMGQAKIALQVKSEDEIELLQARAVSLGICAQIIHDAGRTQIASGSATVLGVGPAPKSVVDQITGGLKLL